ncbi:hypothetical protein CYMTET_55179 [Cymbomonas tetramitiformis]|uniref:Uncharacterized protein n=1 Tax=Cymbomonas tetramitiformis TaxID=36881 RepID=A0AAE0BEQ2_9CHLO|nr:hypothetical protein CYMTET_55179 [Cymbomonas tetramitiformis]
MPTTDLMPALVQTMLEKVSTDEVLSGVYDLLRNNEQVGRNAALVFTCAVSMGAMYLNGKYAASKLRSEYEENGAGFWHPSNYLEMEMHDVEVVSGVTLRDMLNSNEVRMQKEPTE